MELMFSTLTQTWHNRSSENSCWFQTSFSMNGKEMTTSTRSLQISLNRYWIFLWSDVYVLGIADLIVLPVAMEKNYNVYSRLFPWKVMFFLSFGGGWRLNKCKHTSWHKLNFYFLLPDAVFRLSLILLLIFWLFIFAFFLSLCVDLFLEYCRHQLVYLWYMCDQSKQNCENI